MAHRIAYCLMSVIIFLFMTGNANALPVETRMTVANAPSYELKLVFGSSSDDLDFVIDGTTYGVPGMRISERWEKIKVHKGSLHWDGRLTDTDIPDNIALRLSFSGSYGLVEHGTAREEGTSSSGTFSRIYADTDDGFTWDASLGVGIDISTRKFPSIRFTPMLGFSRYVQHFNKVNARETLDPFGWSSWPDYYPIGAIANMDSEFEADWEALWRGLEVNYFPGKRFQIRFSYRNYWRADYSGEATSWDVRNSRLSESRSFIQNGRGDGNMLSAEFVISLGQRLKITASYIFRKFEIDGGTHKANMQADGSERYLKLDQVEWSSQSFLAGIEYRF